MIDMRDVNTSRSFLFFFLFKKITSSHMKEIQLLPTKEIFLYKKRKKIPGPLPLKRYLNMRA